MGRGKKKGILSSIFNSIFPKTQSTTIVEVDSEMEKWLQWSKDLLYDWADKTEIGFFWEPGKPFHEYDLVFNNLKTDKTGDPSTLDKGIDNNSQ